MSELEEQSATYQRITGGMTAPWEGKELPLPQLAPFLKEPDRDVRERAFRASTAPYVNARAELAPLFDRMYGLRQQVARNAGFGSFRDYVFKAKLRFDYSPADCERFHDAVERHVMPAYDRLDDAPARAAEAALAASVGRRRRPLWREAAAPVQRRHRARRPGPGGVRPGRSGARRPVRRHDRRAAARPRQSGGEGAGWLLRHAPLERAAIHLHERGRAHGRRHDAPARGRARLPCLRRAAPAARLAAASRIGGLRARIDVDGAPVDAASGAAARVLRAGGPAARPARASRGRDHHPGARGLGRRLPALDLHRIRTGPTPRARDAAWLRIRSRFDQGVDWCGPGTGARRPLVPAAAHLPLPVLLHRVRHRPARRAAGLAEQPARPGGRRAPLPRRPGARATPARCPISTRAAGATARLRCARPSGELVQLVEDQVDRLRAEVPAAA